MDSGQIGLLVALIILIMFSAFFSASEMALTSVNKIRLVNMEADGNKRAGKVLSLTERFDNILSTVLVGNNIVNITSSSIATIFFGSLILSDAGLATTVSTIVMTVVVLIFGEITPKMFAKQWPEKFALTFYPLLKFFLIILTPFNLIFNGWKWLLKKIFRFEKQATITEGELITIVETAESEGELESHESQLIRSAIEFEDLDVRDIMIPRVNVIAVDETADMESIYAKFTEHGFSRMPVYTETIDSVIGIIHEKDFYALMHDGGTSVKGIIQASVCVTNTMKISTVLRMLQKAKVHMAIVVDEFGGTEGIVTLEDILEELVGEIYDEHDEIEETFRKCDDGSYLVAGDENLEEIYEKLEISLPKDEVESTTLGGYVIELMDKIPQAGDTVSTDSVTFEVTKASTKHVHEVKITLVSDDDDDEDDEQ